jgi:hypothetical protein
LIGEPAANLPSFRRPGAYGWAIEKTADTNLQELFAERARRKALYEKRRARNFRGLEALNREANRLLGNPARRAEEPTS